MIKDCHSFERRMQQLMDSRIDPETDQSLWQHSAECADCYQSLMACSLMHSEFLNDSDSMKLKLDTIGLHEIKIRKKQERQPRWGYFAVVASGVAAILVLSCFLVLPSENDQQRELALSARTTSVENSHSLEPSQEQVERENQQVLASFTSLRRSLDPFEITTLTNEWAPMRPLKSLSACFDWLHRSFKRSKEAELGDSRESSSILGTELKYLAMRV